MSKFEPDFKEGDKIVNLNTGEAFTIKGMEYSKKKCTIEYKIQHYRMKFDMDTITEIVINHNIEKENYKVVR